jgi:hypothetical protein
MGGRVVVTRRRGLVAALLSLALLAGPGVPAQVGAAESCRLPPSDEDRARLSGLSPVRPRIVAAHDDFVRVVDHIQNDPVAESWWTELRAEAGGMVGQRPTRYERVGGRLQFHAYKNRIVTLGLAWRLDADPALAEQAERELLAAAAFPDWNPGHYLDTAEMTAATALGYDWFYEALSPDARDTIRRAIVGKGLRTSRCFYREGRGPVTRHDNWGVVTNAGLAMGAMAVAETNPTIAAAVLGHALRRVQPAMGRFAPDGSYAEGLAYWRYATEHAVKLVATLESGFGEDFGLGAIGGFAQTGSFPLHSTGPTRKVANFADSTTRLGAAPQLYWLARQYGRPVDAWLARWLARRKRSPLHLLWYSPDRQTPGAGGVSPAVLSDVGTTFMRGRWGRKRVGYAAVKGGSNHVAHAHPELGAFIWDVKGKRWAIDLGRDNFNLPGYFDSKRRKQYYRLSTKGQNTLTINGREQPRAAAATVRHFGVEEGRSEVVLGLGRAYQAAKRVKRGVAMLGRRTLLVQDEIATDESVTVVWRMHTRADIELGPDRTSARLRLGDEHVTARIIDAGGYTARFRVASAEQSEPEATNSGVQRLVIRIVTDEPAEGALSRLRLAVLLSPTAKQEPPPVEPLRRWDD